LAREVKANPPRGEGIAMKEGTRMETKWRRNEGEEAESKKHKNKEQS